ncbi:tetratricopeptide repeat protein [Streptomyces sp. NPDC089919]|uniref:tetratricopeptide repeat protein n=1 Tax=Streptomyces sp. NPDC089919 TaxID=3155188 RepID=UPI00342438DF
MLELFQVLGGIAGFGGVTLGVLFLLYRDFVRNIIQQKMFRTLTATQATGLFGAVLVFAFTIAILGIFATLADGEGTQQFMVLVGMLLLFLLVVLLLAGRLMTGGRNRDAAQPPAGEAGLTRVSRLVAAGEPDQAERTLEGGGTDRDSEEFWYWKARIALARGNTAVAAGYVEEALTVDPDGEHGIALKIRILLARQESGDLDEALRLAAKGDRMGGELGVWIRRLRAEGMFEPRVRTATELDARCPLPARQG